MARLALLPPVATGCANPGATIESSSTALIGLGGRSSSECMAIADPRGTGGVVALQVEEPEANPSVDPGLGGRSLSRGYAPSFLRLLAHCRSLTSSYF